MRKKPRTPAKWIKPGAAADYHPIIGEPASRSVTVTHEPTLLGGHTWCVMVDGVSGLVCCDALTEAASA